MSAQGVGVMKRNELVVETASASKHKVVLTYHLTSLPIYSFEDGTIGSIPELFRNLVAVHAGQ